MFYPSLIFLPPWRNLWTPCKWDGRPHPDPSPSSKRAPATSGQPPTITIRLVCREKLLELELQAKSVKVYPQKRGLQKQKANCKRQAREKRRRSCKTFQDFVRLHQVSVCSWSREWIVWTLQDSLSHLGQRLFLSAKSLPTNEKVDSGEEKHYLKWFYCDQWSYLWTCKAHTLWIDVLSEAWYHTLYKGAGDRDT